MCKRGEKIRVVGVSRGNEYSPNHVDNDAGNPSACGRSIGENGV